MEHISASPQHTRECSPEDDYDRAEAWCRRTIAAGQEMLFCPRTFQEEIGKAAGEVGLSFEALHSLFRNAHVAHTKRTSRSARAQTMRHVKSYLNGTSILNLAKKCNYPPSMMARLIVENVAVSPPSHSYGGDRKLEGRGRDGGGGANNREGGEAKLGSKAKGTNTNVKKFVTEALRHPEKVLGCAATSILSEYAFSEHNGTIRQEGLVDEFSGRPLYDGEADGGDGEEKPERLSRLALEVRQAIDADPMYGPRQDKERHNVGIEYELLLERTLRSMDLPFETEEDLRARGTAKTPDILLSIPVGVKVRRREPLRGRGIGSDAAASPSPLVRDPFDLDDDDEYEWKIICWIDSKALFGDVETHEKNVLPQVETYVHRFGPGLVLYWFGHAPLSRLGDGHGDVVIVGGNLPDVVLMPTGEFHGRGGLIETPLQRDTYLRASHPLVKLSQE